MKITNFDIRPFVMTIAGSAQSNASHDYQRKPVPYRLQKAGAAGVTQRSFREILERELGVTVIQGKAAKPAPSQDAETTQFLSGYWA